MWYCYDKLLSRDSIINITLAKKADIDDALGFINTFIQQEKELRTYEN